MDNILGYACGLGAGDAGCADGPAFLFNNYPIENQQIFYPVSLPDKAHQIEEICQRLAEATCQLTKDNKFFHVIGGDHSCAVGTWTGVAKALGPENPLGLIWIDAHMDAHTPTTSLSGNIHGMPVATLLASVIKPANICLIGIRSYESSELDLLKSLNVKIYFIEEVKRRGLDEVFQEAHQIVTAHTKGWGLSLDLDGLDPDEAPGVGTPEINGVASQELIQALKKYAVPDKYQGTLKGFEIAEFNPHLDKDHKTVDLIMLLMDIL